MDAKRKIQKFNRKPYAIVLLVILAVVSILYLLADRYLIEHVEAKVSKEETISNTASTPVNAVYDDWNYKSDNIEISIKKVQSGSGKEKVTYFVADIIIQDYENLRSAFAKDKFGRNIVETTAKIASDNNAIFAVNGDYYGFRRDGIIIRNGTLYRDEPVRTATALYKDGTMSMFDEKQVEASALIENGVMNTFSFGPVLVEDGKAMDSKARVVVDTNFGNQPIQDLNPRTGIGMISANHFVFIVVDGRMNNYSRGMTLYEFAGLFVDLGCVEAYNLDGGGSSTMYFMGRVVNNPLGKHDERAISDIIYITE